MVDAEATGTPAVSSTEAPSVVTVSRDGAVLMNVKSMVGCTVVGHDWHFYIAFVSKPVVAVPHDNGKHAQAGTFVESNTGGVARESELREGENKYTIVGPWQSFEASTRDIVGLFKILAIIKEVGEIARLDYWPWLRDSVLLPLLL